MFDFANDTEEMLAAFKAHHTAAKLSATTNPNRVFNVRANLDVAGHCNDVEWIAWWR